MKTIRIEYLGKGSKTVELPIPFISKSEKTGQVVCDPVGEFPEEDGLRLLEIAGDDGLFRIARQKQVCQCGCEAEIAWKKHHEDTPPRFLPGHNMTAKFKKTQSEATAPSPQ